MISFRSWLLLAALTILGGILVPYGVLSGTAAALDVFLFWCLFGLAVVVLMAVGTSGWRK